MPPDSFADHLEPIFSDLIHLARFGVEGRSRDVKALVRKMSQSYRSRFPELSASLAAVTASEGALRSAKRPLPLDADSRMALARIIPPDQTDFPVLSSSLAEQVQQLIDEHERVAALRQAGLAPSRSALLVGPPGVGKTMAARWIAHKLGRPLVVLDLASSMSSFLGKTGQNLRQLFDFAKEFDCVLLLDEVDAIAKKRADDTDLGELKRLVNVLLQELDEWPEGSLMLAATNHPDLLDPAVWRRFDVVLNFPLPSAAERRIVLERLLQHESSRFIGPLSDLSEGMNLAEMVNRVNSGLRTAVLKDLDHSEGVLSAFVGEAKLLPKARRHDLADKLLSAGLTQRAVSELTGTSRNTIRKNATGEEAK